VVWARSAANALRGCGVMTLDADTDLSQFRHGTLEEWMSGVIPSRCGGGAPNKPTVLAGTSNVP
jgi:hypothetical protein